MKKNLVLLDEIKKEALSEIDKYRKTILNVGSHDRSKIICSNEIKDSISNRDGGFINQLKRQTREKRLNAINDLKKLREFAKEYKIRDFQGLLDKNGNFYLNDPRQIYKRSQTSTIIDLNLIDDFLIALGAN